MKLHAMAAMLVVCAVGCGGVGDGSTTGGTSSEETNPQGSSGPTAGGASGAEGSQAANTAGGQATPAQPTAEQIVSALQEAKTLIDPNNRELVAITDALIQGCQAAPVACVNGFFTAGQEDPTAKTPKLFGLPSIDWTCLPYKTIPTWWATVATLAGLHASGILSTRARCDALVALGSAALSAGLDGSLVYQALLGAISVTGGHCACKYAI